MSTYGGSTSFAIEFRPAAPAASVVEPVPAKGSRTVSPAKENIRMSRSASSRGYWAGGPGRVERYHIVSAGFLTRDAHVAHDAADSAARHEHPRTLPPHLVELF